MDNTIRHTVLRDKISFYLLAAFLATLPFDRFYSELALIGFVLHTLIHIDRKKIKAAFSVPVLLASSVFLLTVIGIIYSQDKAQASRDLQRQAAIFLFPVCLAASGLNLPKYKMKLLLVFAFTCVITILYLYIDALRIILYYKFSLSSLFSSYFINHNFSQSIGIHATYMSMYCMLSASIIVYYSLREKRQRIRLIYGLSFIILLAGVLQLASRAVFISAFLITVCFAFMQFRRTQRTNFILAAGAIALFAVIIISNITSLKTRYISTLREDLAEGSPNVLAPEPRAMRWRVTLKLIGRSPLYGHGSGSEKRLLNESYFQNKLYVSYINELNAHNQYMSITLKTGAWGLFVFLYTLCMALAVAIRSKDILFCSFLAIVATVSFSENILDVNKGIFFYAFFVSFFLLSGKPFGPFLRLGRGQPLALPRTVNQKENAATVRSHNHL